jgi:hypothetical protein
MLLTIKSNEILNLLLIDIGEIVINDSDFDSIVEVKRVPLANVL